MLFADTSSEVNSEVKAPSENIIQCPNQRPDYFTGFLKGT